MRIVAFLWMLIAAAFVSPVSVTPAYAQATARPMVLSGDAGAAPHMRVRLEAENPNPAPGERVTIAILMEPEAGWHGYWENPGDAGLPMDLRWSLPDGMKAGALRYPVPHGLLVAGLMNHVFEGRYAVLTEVTVPQSARAGSRLPIEVQGNWLVCSDTICVPEQGRLNLDLTVGDAGKTGAPPHQAVFDQYRQRLPRPLGGEALFQGDGRGGIRIAVPFPASAALSEPHFFALTPGTKSYAAPQRIERDGDRLVITLNDFTLADGPLKGVLRIGANQGIAISAQAGVVPPAAGRDGARQGGWTWRIVLLSFGGAVLGGLILNIMPCVFPILSLKAMSLLRTGASSAGQPSHAKAEAWAYTAGVVLTCMALGAVVLALRAGGESVGWAFQLQSPAIITMLLALCVAIALNFAGVFMLTPLQMDGRLATRKGLSGDFWSGVLVAFVATPCTGPFMATALGAALLLPALASLAVFAGLGLGMALPFLILAYAPALRAHMPKPGAWMERVQRWLSLPLFLTAAALLWLLWRQAGESGLAAGALLAAVVTLALVWFGRRQKSGFHSGGLVVLAGCLAVAGVSALTVTSLPRPDGGAAAGEMGDEAYTETALTRALAADKPVFLYFTADWCLSCKVNEAAAINRADVRAAFDKAGVTTIVGDWSSGNPAITRFLEDHGRSGVPLYLWYPAGEKEPRELPQLLTPGLLVRLAEGKDA